MREEVSPIALFVNSSLLMVYFVPLNLMNPLTSSQCFQLRIVWSSVMSNSLIIRFFKWSMSIVVNLVQENAVFCEFGFTLVAVKFICCLREWCVVA